MKSFQEQKEEILRRSERKIARRKKIQNYVWAATAAAALMLVGALSLFGRGNFLLPSGELTETHIEITWEENRLLLSDSTQVDRVCSLLESYVSRASLPSLPPESETDGIKYGAVVEFPDQKAQLLGSAESLFSISVRENGEETILYELQGRVLRQKETGVCVKLNDQELLALQQLWEER